jgi:hypothetical protein
MADLRSAGLHTSPIVAATVAGVIAGVPTGIVLQFGTDVMTLLGSFAGGSVVVGWIVHLALSALFGGMFGWIVEWPVFRTLTDTTAGTVFLGVVHGVVWYAYVVIGIVVPGIVRLLGYDPVDVVLSLVPGTTTVSLLTAGAFAFAYLTWGAILGFAYAWIEAESEEPEPRGPDGERNTTESD